MDGQNLDGASSSHDIKATLQKSQSLDIKQSLEMESMITQFIEAY